MGLSMKEPLLLNFYKPVIDEREIDLIILKEKIYNPIYLQIKTRFNVHKRNNLGINYLTGTLLSQITPII